MKMTDYHKQKLKNMLANKDIMEAAVEGRTIEYNGVVGWKAAWDLGFTDEPKNYRIKREPLTFYANKYLDDGTIYYHSTKAKAIEAAAGSWKTDFIGVKFIEVIEDED